MITGKLAPVCVLVEGAWTTPATDWLCIPTRQLIFCSSVLPTALMQTHKDVTDINLQLKARPHRAITALSLSQRVLGVEGEMKYQIRPFGQQRRSAWISGFFYLLSI